MASKKKFISNSKIKMLENEIDEIGYEFAFMVAEILKENINDLWYDEYDPKDYSRSYQILDAIDVDKLSSGKHIVYINSDYIHAERMRNNLNRHASFYMEDVSDRISEWMDKGVNQADYPHPSGEDGAGFWDATYNWVKRNEKDIFSDLIVKQLASRGINAKKYKMISKGSLIDKQASSTGRITINPKFK